MTKDDRSDRLGPKALRLALLSERVLGASDEIDGQEAEELLRAAGSDSQELKTRLHRRFDGLAKQYASEGRRVPALLKHALADLRPGLSESRAERELLREARTAVRALLKKVKELPQLLTSLPDLTIAAAYRNRKDLSEHDRQLLDELAAHLQNHANDRNVERRRKEKA